MDSEVVVIGGGLSGLSAAKWLQEAGVSVLVLEARDRVGGRTYTKKDPKVNYVDLGGSYVGATQHRLLRMAKELGVETYNVNVDQDILYYQNGNVRYSDSSSLPRYANPFINMDINNMMWTIDKMGEEIPTDAPWKAPRAKQWDTMTFQEFLEKYCWTEQCKVFLRGFLTLNTATEPHEVSLLSFLWYIKQCGGTKRIDSTEEGAQERKFIGGSQQLSDKISAKLGEGVVVKSSPVVGIDQENEDYVIVRTLSGTEYKTKHVILAMSPVLQMKIHFSPPLPALRNQLIQRMPMGTVTKVILYYDRTFWREKGLCGLMTIEGDDNHPMTSTMDDTKPDGTHPAIVGFIIGDRCRRATHLTPNQRKDVLAKSLATVSGCPEFLKPVHYEEKNWTEEQYSGGCYTSMHPPGFFTGCGAILRDPVDRVYFAGTETAIKWSGYMDGAIEAGERAAREILCKMGKIPEDQIWLDEPHPEDEKSFVEVETFGAKYIPSVSGFLKTVTFSTVLGAVSFFAIKKDIFFSRS